MAGGSPRTVSLQPHEMVELGKEMIKWIIENDEKLNILHLSEWYTVHKMFTYNQWKAFIQLPEFLPYYEKALKIIGKKYLDKTSNIREGASQRFMRTYFNDLREIEDQDHKETKTLESALRKEEDQNRPQTVIIEKWKPSE